MIRVLCHTNWTHPKYIGKLTVSGKDSSDAKTYQEKDVQQAIKEVEEKQQEENQEDELSLSIKC